MWYRIQRTVACLLAVVSVALGASSAQAGWGHHWGRHHHHHYYGNSLGWGFPSYSYSSFYFSFSRPRFYYPAYSASYYSYYVPSYTVSLPTYYYATPTYYVAPSYYVAPLSYPSNCCDPCVSSVLNSSPTYSAPTYSQPEYSTGTSPQLSPAPSQLAGGSFVDRMLQRNSGLASSIPLRAPDVSQTAPSAIAQSSRDGLVRTVSTLKPVTSTTPRVTSVDALSPIPAALLKAADDIFAAGGYEEAASAYAKLTVRYGNHDELVVRRFIAFVASGNHAQASVVYELAMASDRPINVDTLTGGLAKLYGASAATRKNHIESLAAYALRSANEALPLSMVGTWLELDGQAQRAATFHQRAAMLNNPTEPVSSPALANRLAELPLAR